MKIEAEVHNSLYTFASVESKCAGGAGTGCSVNGGELPPIAQDSERSSIGRPERQLTPPGCGGCGTLPNNGTDGTPLTSVFDCEHFQFIDDDDDDAQTTVADEGVAAPAAGDQTSPTLGTSSNNDDDVPSLGATTGSHLLSDQLQPDDRRENDHPAKEVSEELRYKTRDQNNMSSDSRHKGHAVKRQVSFDDAAAVGDGPAKKELKSLLKKGNRFSKKQKSRSVTFDEAVTLYSDENEGIQLLALTTGPDIICTEVFYTFEPPIEYQDIPPFEPPAEYRDPDEVNAVPDSKLVENVSDQAIQCTPENNDLEIEMGSDHSAAEPVIENSTNQNMCQQPTPVEVCSEVAVSKETENAATAACEIPKDDSDSNQTNAESVRESDKLIERFLEAEGVFPIDEELNSVFHELQSDFANDGQNGALDDNLFRNLITYLSSAERDIPLEAGEFFSTTTFANSADDACHETEDDESSQTHSRTLSEADSDCSISSQDTIIVRLGEDDSEQGCTDKNSTVADKIKVFESEHNSVPMKNNSILVKQGSLDEVFGEKFTDTPSSDEKPRPIPRESLAKNIQMYQTAVKMDRTNEESLSRQSSGEQSVNSGNSQDPPQDADDSTSSDSRSGEVEEEIRLDDIGYDEEDADDYDEESFRGMAHGNSKIRRIIKKNALQCTLFRGIEAKRRQQPGIKYPRPKSPLLSQESLVEKLKWLTTIDEQKDSIDGSVNFHSKPPDVILSAGGIPVNGSIPHSTSSEDNMLNQPMSYQQQQFYQMQRFQMPLNSKGGYYIRHDGYHPSLPRPRMQCTGHTSQMMQHNLPYPPNRMVAHPPNPQMQWADQRNMSSMTVPRNFRDWRVIQRVMVNRSSEGSNRVPADYVRCANGSTYSPSNVPPDVSRTSQQPRSSKDELEQFVEQDSKRLERIRKRYSLAEDEDDPTFGFARRPSVKGVQSRIQANPSELVQGHGTNKMDHYTIFEESGQGLHSRAAAYSADQTRTWSRDPNWRSENSSQLYGSAAAGRSQGPMHIHRASVALTELPGNATIPYTHRKHPDTRYHSYAESMYGSTRTLPTKSWVPPDPRMCHNVSNPASAHQVSTVPAVSSQMLQVPPHAVVASKDERGVPEGASSSPKISSDSLYHSPVPDSITSGGPHKDEGVIYYSLNV